MNADLTTIYVQPALSIISQHIVTYPIASGKFINLVAYCSYPALHEEWEKGPWVVEAEHEEVLHQYRDFEPEVQALLKVRIFLFYFLVHHKIET